MTPKRDGPAKPQPVPGHNPPAIRCLARGAGWRIDEVVCQAGPGDAPFEERHGGVSIAAVVEGTFQYRCSAGRALLYPGAFLLGNVGTCFECGHDHGAGDRCIAFQFAPDYFEDIAATAAGSSRFRFPMAMLPPLPATMGLAVAAEDAALSGSLAAEELAVRIAERTLRLASGHRMGHAAPSGRDEKRISAALRLIEARAGDPLDLDALAHVAAMSKYHFLRTFRRVVGCTPYRYLRGVRLRRAALALTVTRQPVAAIALEAGFGDISTFNAYFRQVFGVVPSQLRGRDRGRGGLMPLEGRKAF
jgi:AraC family transcriptional regulator